MKELEKHDEEEGEEGLTISSSSQEREESSKMNVFLPVLALTVIDVGTFWYYRESKKDPGKPKEDSRPKTRDQE